MRISVATKLASGFLIYVLGADLGLQFIGRAPMGISLFCAPLFYIFRPLYPLLKILGLLEGEYWQLPSPLGFIFCGLVYAGILYLLAKTIRP